MPAEMPLPALDPMPVPGPPWLFHALWLVTFAVHVVGVNVVLGASILGTLASFDRDRAFADATGRVRLVLEPGGTITVTRGYAWNGCSPKFRLLDLLVGTPEGVVNARTGQRKTYYASLVHDALYQFLGDGLPLARKQADLVFLFLMRESGFRLAPVYWLFVRAFGGLVHLATRRARGWRGAVMRIDAEAPPPAAAPPAALPAPSSSLALILTDSTSSSLIGVAKIRRSSQPALPSLT